jgi:hypothetical protein
MHETDLYPIIRKQWPGVTVRIDAPSRPGISDLVLVGAITVFAEIKLALTIREKLQITAPQFRFIQQVVVAGGYSCAIVYVMENRHWYLIIPDLLEREWPVVRAAMGLDLGRNLETLEAKIRSTIPRNGTRFDFTSCGAINFNASAAELVCREKANPELITSLP